MLHTHLGKIKNLYYAADDSETAGKKSIIGALTLYLDFILMFQFFAHSSLNF